MADGKRYEGTIVRMHERGYAFVSVPNESDLFLHFSDFAGAEWNDLLMERRVSFEVKTADNGRRRAIRCRLVE